MAGISGLQLAEGPWRWQCIAIEEAQCSITTVVVPFVVRPVTSYRIPLRGMTYYPINVGVSFPGRHFLDYTGGQTIDGFMLKKDHDSWPCYLSWGRMIELLFFVPNGVGGLCFSNIWGLIKTQQPTATHQLHYLGSSLSLGSNIPTI